MTIVPVSSLLGWAIFVTLFGVGLLGYRAVEPWLLSTSGGINLMAGSLAGGIMNNPQAWPALVLGLVIIQVGLAITWRMDSSRPTHAVRQALGGMGTTAAYTVVFILLFIRT